MFSNDLLATIEQRFTNFLSQKEYQPEIANILHFLANVAAQKHLQISREILQKTSLLRIMQHAIATNQSLFSDTVIWL